MCRACLPAANETKGAETYFQPNNFALHPKNAHHSTVDHLKHFPLTHMNHGRILSDLRQTRWLSTSFSSVCGKGGAQMCGPLVMVWLPWHFQRNSICKRSDHTFYTSTNDGESQDWINDLKRGLVCSVKFTVCSILGGAKRENYMTRSYCALTTPKLMTEINILKVLSKSINPSFPKFLKVEITTKFALLRWPPFACMASVVAFSLLKEWKLRESRRKAHTYLSHAAQG